MLISVGGKLGPYEILAPIGAGGMGNVYKARDTRLDRIVAIKVSKTEFSERFEREARAVASLNHSNICTLFDVGPNYLVMELIEGPTLRERIALGAIHLEETLEIAKQIADALEAAHEKGIVHRDLKPSNIKIRPDGTVKVLDFGLAKIAGTPSAQTEDSPTISMSATHAGVILGTAAYMSPEQARGKEVDKRADIWAFGVVLYEMLTGKKLFHGDDLSETLASVIKEEPKLEQLPAKMQHLLRSCLEKDPKQRLRDIGDVWRLMEESSRPTDSAKVSSKWLWAAVAAAFAVVAAIGWLRPDSRPNEVSGATLTIVPPSGVVLYEVGRGVSAPEISPNGSAIMYGAEGGLYVRRLDSMEPKHVPGSEIYSNDPFWSPDSSTVVYPSFAKLVKVRVPDGPPQVITALTGPTRGGSWSDKGTILIGGLGGLLTVPASGGDLRKVEMPPALSDGSYRNPEFLPGGEDFLFGFIPSLNADDASVCLATLRNGKVADPVFLLKNSTSASYTPAGGGRILFVRNDNLYSQQLNRRTRRLEGEPEIVAQGVASQPSTNVYLSDFSVARNGTVTWRPGKAASSQVTIFDRQGRSIGTVGPAGPYANLELSPDEKRVLASSDRSWLMDVGQPGATPLPGGALWFAWSPDSSKLFGVSGSRFVEMPATGSGEMLHLHDFGNIGYRGPADISPDGKRAIANTDHGIVSLLIEGAPEASAPSFLVKTEALLFGPRFSPDGRWFTYGDESAGGLGGGLFVQPFPGPGRRRQIAASGLFAYAMWRRDGKEIIYIDRGSVKSLAVEPAGSDLHFAAPRTLFSGLRYPSSAVTSSHPLAISRDGSRIFWLQGADQPDSNMIQIKTGWIKER